MHRENQRLLILFIANILVVIGIALIFIQPVRVKLAYEQIARREISQNLDKQRQRLADYNRKISGLKAALTETTSVSNVFAPLSVERVAGVHVVSWRPRGAQSELQLALDWPRVKLVLEYLTTVNVSLEKLEIRRDKTRLLMQVTMNHANVK